MLEANAMLALAAAVLWGGGDFSGGMGAKNAGGTMRGALCVVLTSHAASFCVLVVLASLSGDPFPRGGPFWWGLLAGVMGGLSLTGFYVALSRGAMGVSAAISGLLAAAIPAAVSIAGEGSPGWRRIVGFLRCRSFDLDHRSRRQSRGEAGFERDDVARDPLGCGLRGLLYRAEVCRRRGRGVADGDGQDRKPDDLFPDSCGDELHRQQRKRERMAAPEGRPVGAFDGATGYLRQYAVYRFDASREAGCRGRTGIALSGFDDSTGSVDAS